MICQGTVKSDKRWEGTFSVREPIPGKFGVRLRLQEYHKGQLAKSEPFPVEQLAYPRPTRPPNGGCGSFQRGPLRRFRCHADGQSIKRRLPWQIQAQESLPRQPGKLSLLGCQAQSLLSHLFLCQTPNPATNPVRSNTSVPGSGTAAMPPAAGWMPLAAGWITPADSIDEAPTIGPATACANPGSTLRRPRRSSSSQRAGRRGRRRSACRLPR